MEIQVWGVSWHGRRGAPPWPAEEVAELGPRQDSEDPADQICGQIRTLRMLVQGNFTAILLTSFCGADRTGVASQPESESGRAEPEHYR